VLAGRGHRQRFPVMTEARAASSHHGRRQIRVRGLLEKGKGFRFCRTLSVGFRVVGSDFPIANVAAIRPSKRLFHPCRDVEPRQFFGCEPERGSGGLNEAPREDATGVDRKTCRSTVGSEMARIAI
jgi:hypothetical protein